MVHANVVKVRSLMKVEDQVEDWVVWVEDMQNCGTVKEAQVATRHGFACMGNDDNWTEGGIVGI